MPEVSVHVHEYIYKMTVMTAATVRLVSSIFLVDNLYNCLLSEVQAVAVLPENY